MGIVGFIGLLMMLGFLIMTPIGIFLIVKSRNPGLKYPSCGGCGYDLTGSTAATELCPECGGQFTAVGIVPPQPGRRRNFLVIGVILLLLPFMCGGLLTLGVYRSTGSVQQARRQALIAQQQAIKQQLAVAQQLVDAQQQAVVDALTQDWAQIEKDLATLTEQIELESDEDIRRALQARIVDLQRTP